MGSQHMERSRLQYSQQGGSERSTGEGQQMEGSSATARGQGGPQRIRNVLTRRLVREIYAMRPVKPKPGQTGPANAMQGSAGFPFFSHGSQMPMYGTGASYKESCTKVSNRLAAVYNVNAKTVRDIWNRRSWQAATRDMWTEDEKAQYRSRPAMLSEDSSETASKNNSPSSGPSSTAKKDQNPPPFIRAGSSSSSSSGSGSQKTGTTMEASPRLDPNEYTGSSTPGLTAADRQMLSMLEKTSGRAMSTHNPAMAEANAILEQYLQRAAGRGGKVDLSILDQMVGEFPGHLQPTKQEIHDQRAGSRNSWQNNRPSAQAKQDFLVVKSEISKADRSAHVEHGFQGRVVHGYETLTAEFPSPPAVEQGEPFFFKEDTEHKALHNFVGEPDDHRHMDHDHHREIPDWQFPSQNTSQDPFNPEWSSLPMW